MRRAHALLGATGLLLTAGIALAAPASAAGVSPAASTPAASSGQASSGQPATASEAPGSGSRDAEAQCADDFAYPGINIRALPNTGSSIRGQGNPGDCLTYHKVTTGQNTYCPELGVWGDQWYDVTNNRTGVRGWILGCYVT